MDELPSITDGELEYRVIYLFLAPVARLGTRNRVPLRDLRDLLEMACFQQLRQASYTLDESAEILDVSRRKAAQLSKQLKHNFFDFHSGDSITRRIEYLLWAGELTEGRLKQELSSHSESAIDSALSKLVAAGRIEAQEEQSTTRYSLPSRGPRLFAGDLMDVLEELENTIMSIVELAAERFLEG